MGFQWLEGARYQQQIHPVPCCTLAHAHFSTVDCLLCQEHMGKFAKSSAYGLEQVGEKSWKVTERTVHDEKRALLADKHHPCPGSDGHV